MWRVTKFLALLLMPCVAWASSPTYFQTVQADNPTSWWHLDEASGNVVDVINGVTLSPTGGISYSQTGALSDGSGDTAVKFNGTTGFFNSGVQIGGNTFYTDYVAGYGWTLELWYKLTALPVSAPQSIVDLSTAANYANELLIGTTGQLQFNIYGGGTSGTGCQNGTHGTLASSGTLSADGNYHHIVVTTIGKGSYACGGDTCQGISSIKLYIDGALDASGGTFNYTDLNHTECTSNSDVVFGNFLFVATGREILNGSLDEVAYYKNGSPASALSARQVFCHYEAGIGTPCGAERRRVYQMQ